MGLLPSFCILWHLGTRGAQVPRSHPRRCVRAPAQIPHGTHPFARARQRAAPSCGRSPRHCAGAHRHRRALPPRSLRTLPDCARLSVRSVGSEPSRCSRTWIRTATAKLAAQRLALGTPERALTGRRERPRFSACALPLSPPRPFTERKRWNGLFSNGRSFLPKIKTAFLKLFFRGSPWCPAFLAAKEQNVEITGLGVEEISSRLCLGVPVCVCPPTPQRQICSHAHTLQIILSCGCDASVKSEVFD